MQVFEKFLQLETRISCQCLPHNFQTLENFIAPDLYTPVINDPIALEFQHQREKIIREAKRAWLYNYAHLYEIILQNYEQRYQRDLHQLQLNTSSNAHMTNDDETTTSLFQSFTTYMDHRVNRIKREIRAEKIPRYRTKLLRLQRRQQLFSTNGRKLVDVSPQVIIDLICHPFNVDELAYLSRGN